MTENKPEILLAEKNHYDVEFMLEALERFNLTDKTMVFRDGGDVLDYIAATGKYSGCKTCEKLRVIILDINLPKVDGLEILQRIRTNEDTRMVPVVIFSSSTTNRDRIKSYELGANSYINKPDSYNGFVNTFAEIGSYWILQNVPAW
ncbi:MAG TPA: response regulator [Syntrophales bacterium]|nr:response regulator [Syntrophales bacterium]